jgi:hypothetical protein
VIDVIVNADESHLTGLCLEVGCLRRQRARSVAAT